ncbi:hypothetical protein ACOMHN_053506 [Nucella lapillus]
MGKHTHTHTMAKLIRKYHGPAFGFQEADEMTTCTEVPAFRPHLHHTPIIALMDTFTTLQSSLLWTPSPHSNHRSYGHLHHTPIIALMETFTTPPIIALMDTFTTPPIIALMDTFTTPPIIALMNTFTTPPIIALMDTFTTSNYRSFLGPLWGLNMAGICSLPLLISLLYC